MAYLDLDAVYLISAAMANNPPGNNYELQCNDAYFALMVEALKIHSLRTRRIQSLRKLLEIALHDEFWRTVSFDVDDLQKLLRSCGRGSIVFHLMMPRREVEILRVAKTELQERVGRPLSTLETFAILMRLSLDVGGAEWVSVV